MRHPIFRMTFRKRVAAHSPSLARSTSTGVTLKRRLEGILPPLAWQEVRLRYAYLVTCEEVIKNDAGEVIEVICRYDPESRGGISPDGRKVKGTIQWVEAASALPFEGRVYDRLFSSEAPEDVPDGQDFTVNLNPKSDLRYPEALIERSVGDDPPETRYQFERLGYYWQDPVDSTRRPLDLQPNRHPPRLLDKEEERPGAPSQRGQAPSAEEEGERGRACASKQANQERVEGQSPR